ncbi:MAG TPA: hypothetical protein VFT98_12600 [Myxococcota bacterium]|nr:hypothetical protein [Myxococcota bacterium]
MSNRGQARIALAIVFALLGTLACTETVATQARPALAELNAPLRRIAVMPFSATALVRHEAGEESPQAAAQLVSKYVAEALAARGVEVIAPEDVATALAGAGPDELAAAVLARSKGADAVVIGELTRWEEREGEAMGTFHAAAVGFRVALRSAPASKALWSAEFDERQQPLGENVLRAGQYPGAGTRWLTAEELARWGAQEIVRKLPLGPER